MCFLIFASAHLTAQKQQWVQRLEPTFWWTNMHQKELQLMFYGTNISQTEISVNYPGVQILRKVTTDNPNYAFVYLHISPETQPGKFAFELRRGKSIQKISYELKARYEGSAMRETFTEADAIYLIMPDRFANGNISNDEIKGYHQGVNRNDPGLRHGGDLEGIISKIPYLADLGITALWTTPIFENNDTVYSYHHYGTTDYYKVDPRFGTNEDYARLSAVAKQHGIKMILDIVPNHCGGMHWWTKDTPAKDWFNVWEKYTPSNYRMTTWTDPHAAKADLHRLTHGWFAPNMPDFNLNNPLVFDYLRQAYVFWIEYADIAGLRVDTYPYNDIRLAAQFIQSLRNEYPKMNVVGECWMNSSLEVAYYQSGNNNKDGFDSRLQSVMDFALGNAFASAFNEADGWDKGLTRFYMHFAQDFAYHNTHLVMNFLDNHDINRFSNSVNNDVRKFKMALAMLLTTRGYPQIYYGTEIMLDGIPGTYEGTRFTFPGGWHNDSRNAFLSEGRTEKENEVFDYLKKLLHFRKSNPVLHNGKMTQFVPENGIYVYFRYNENKTIMVVVNNNEQNSTLNTQRFREIIGTKKTAVDIFDGKEYKITDPLILNAKSVCIFEVL